MSRNLYPVPDEPADDPYSEPSGNGNHDLDAERIVLGACMLMPAIIAEVRDITPPDRFADVRHEHIAATIYRLADAGEPTDMANVAMALVANPLTRGKFPPVYLDDLVQAVPTAVQAPFYAEIVRERWRKREGAKVGRQIMETCQSVATDDVDEALDRAMARLTSLRELIPAGGLPATAADLLSPTLDQIEHPQPGAAGVATGLHDLDDALDGLRPGQLVYVAARPGIGKSIVLLNMARHVAISLGLPVLYVTLEMAADEVMLRVIAAEAKVDHKRLKTSACDEADWQRIAAAAGPITASKLFIADDPRVTIGSLRSTIRALRDRHGLALVVLDYLQLVEAPRAESRQVAVAEMSRQLKVMAGEMGVPIVAACQLNRAAESRADKRPALADLRESGSLEQDANVVLLLHREDAYERESPRAGEMDIAVAKNRSGPQPEVRVAFQGHYMRAVSLAGSA